MIGRTARRQALVAALVLACALAAAPPLARETRAATPDLTIVGAARYDVQPTKQRVRITVDLVATNHLQDTATKRFYFDRAFIQVQPGTSDYRLTSSSGSPSVRISRRLADSTILQLNFGRRLFSGQTARFQLRFDLPDAGGAPARDVRVGPSLVTFPAWGFGSSETPGGTVSVTFPTGYTIQVFAGPFGAPPVTGSAGSVTYASGKLDDASRFSAFFVADRPATYVETAASATVSGTTVPFKVRSWSDDPAWGTRVTGLFERGLPVTAQLVGLPWSLPAPLVVQEGVSRTTGGYAGLFDPASGHIEVAYYADAFVVLHEAAHSWFNGALLQDRWVNEAFASYYAVQVAKRLSEKVTAEPLTDTLRKSRIPLNDWGGVGTEPAAAEDYAYAASLTVANAIAARAGPNALKAVWAAAAELRAAYQPAGIATSTPAERAQTPPDWRALLDLLEDATGKPFDDLWRTWVVADDEKPLLDARATARRSYVQLVTQAGPWQLPGAIRVAMRAWRFEEATQLMTGAQRVLDRRAELQAAAVEAGVRLPDRIEAAFESVDGVVAANAEADAELATLRAIATASTAAPTDESPLTQLGLLGQSPEQQLADARAAFTRGDVDEAARAANAARSAWADASATGLNRLLAAAAVVLLVLLLLAVLIARRSRPRIRSAPRRDLGF